MKALIIVEEINEADWIQCIKRILVPERNNLIITIYNHHLYVLANFTRTDYTTLKEIDLPEEFINEAIEFMHREKELTGKFKGLFSDNS